VKPDRRKDAYPRGRRAADKGRLVWGLDVEEMYEAGRLGSAFGLVLLTPASATFIALGLIDFFGAAPLAIALMERVAREVRRGMALFLIGGWGGLAASAARQAAVRRVSRTIGAQAVAGGAAGAAAAAVIGETIRRVFAVAAAWTAGAPEPPVSAGLCLAVSLGGGAYLAAGLTLVRAFRHGLLGKRLAGLGLGAAAFAAVLGLFLAVRLGG
jgi:hypothetical protein